MGIVHFGGDNHVTYCFPEIEKSKPVEPSVGREKALSHSNKIVETGESQGAESWLRGFLAEQTGDKDKLDGEVA